MGDCSLCPRFSICKGQTTGYFRPGTMVFQQSTGQYPAVFVATQANVLRRLLDIFLAVFVAAKTGILNQTMIFS